MRFAALLAVLVTALAGSIFTAGTSAQGRGQAVTLPDGPGKEMVEAACAQCHGLNLITNSWGYTHDGWQELLATMIRLPEDRAETIATYLATHFPEKPAPEARILAGPASVTFNEWLAPTLGSRPHDPLMSTDGHLWWTGQFASRLGRVNTETGAMQEYPLPGDAGPHGLVEGLNGHIFYTAINEGYIGELDPATGNVTRHPLNLEGSRGPHTPILDQQGRVWFTLQSGHVGRLDPTSGEMRISATPTSGTYPYGIKVDAQGTPWYVDFRGNRLGSVNPETMVITEYPLPNADSRPRRMDIAADGMIYYTDYPRGIIGQFDPRTGQFVKEWASPGGPDSEPYGIAAVGNILWYSESNVRPNTLVRFDPQAESFQTWIIPSGGGVVRHMMATPEGDLVLACSGVNQVAYVEVSDAANRTY